MNYIAEINAFEQWLESHHLSRDAQFLWYKLMYKANRSGWCDWVVLDNQRLMGIMQTNREAFVISVRNELLNAGLIEYQMGKKGTPGKYHIVSLTCKNEVKSEVESEVKNVVKNVVKNEVKSEVKSEVESVGIYKQNKTNNIINNTCASDTEARNKEEDFGIIYGIYPKKRGRAKAYELYLGWLKGRTINGRKIKLTNRQMYLAVKKYVNECQEDGTDLQYYKNFDTLMGKQILDYVEVDE